MLKHLSPDETPQYLSKTTKLAYAPRKHEKSFIKIKKIQKKKNYNKSPFRIGVLLHEHVPARAKAITSVINPTCKSNFCLPVFTT